MAITASPARRNDKRKRPELDPALSIADIAHNEGVTTRTVRNWIADGLLPTYRAGKHLVRIRHSAYEAFRQGGRDAAA